MKSIKFNLVVVVVLLLAFASPVRAQAFGIDVVIGYAVQSTSQMLSGAIRSRTDASPNRVAPSDSLDVVSRIEREADKLLEQFPEEKRAKWRARLIEQMMKKAQIEPSERTRSVSNEQSTLGSVVATATNRLVGSALTLDAPILASSSTDVSSY